jgi:hypothetical protein
MLGSKKVTVVTTHVTTIPSVNNGLTDRVPTLRDFKTLGGTL